MKKAHSRKSREQPDESCKHHTIITTITIIIMNIIAANHSMKTA